MNASTRGGVGPAAGLAVTSSRRSSATEVTSRSGVAEPGDAFAVASPSRDPLPLRDTIAMIAPVEGPRDPLPRSVDVVIVGAGPVGLTVANLIGSFGLQCLLIDQRTTTSELPKAIAIDDEYMRLLDGLDLTGELASHSSAPFGVHFLSPFGFALVKVPGFVTPNGFGNRNAVLQPVFEKILLRGSRRFPSVSVHFGVTLTGLSQDSRCVAMTLETASGSYEVTARYVLACDGARSFVRTALGIPFPGTRIDEPHLVVDLADFPDQSNYSRFFCNPARPVNSIPGPYGGRRLEFMLSSSDDRQHIVTDQGVRELVDRHTPYRGIRLNIIRRTVYGFSERIAARLADGRVFLLGDAAHVMPPFGGQGMNTGARDAANLCWKVAGVLRGQASEGSLASYELERRHHIKATVDYSVRVGKLANIRSRWLGGLRDAAFGLANLLPNVRRYFREMRHVPRPFITEGLVVRNAGADSDMVGRVLPRLLLIGADNQPTSIDVVAGPWFALVGLSVDLDDLTSASGHPLWRRTRPSLVALASEEDRFHDRLRVADERGRALLAGHSGWVLVLRPDRIVAGLAKLSEFAELSNRLDSLIGSSSSLLRT